MSTAALGDASWLTTGAAARVLKLLNGDGEEARVVGGAVRNALMKLPVGEVDIATTAVPDEVVRRARAAGIKSVPTGHRSRHRDAGRGQHAVRGHDVARGYRDLRPSCQGFVRP